MAKRHEGRVTNITAPSAYGSHQCMIVNAIEHDIILQEGQILCKDDIGVYITTKQHIDSRLADPNRYSGKRI